MWADAGRAIGFEMRYAEIALRNGLGIDQGEYLSRVDSKRTALPWAYIGLNHGLKVIPNAVVQTILIDKVPGGRPVARGAVYKDSAGTMREIRAARVIVALGVKQTPLLVVPIGLWPKGFVGRQAAGGKQECGPALVWRLHPAWLCVFGRSRHARRTGREKREGEAVSGAPPPPGHGAN